MLKEHCIIQMALCKIAIIHFHWLKMQFLLCLPLELIPARTHFLYPRQKTTLIQIKYPDNHLFLEMDVNLSPWHLLVFCCLCKILFDHFSFFYKNNRRRSRTGRWFNNSLIFHFFNNFRNFLSLWLCNLSLTLLDRLCHTSFSVMLHNWSLS